ASAAPRLKALSLTKPVALSFSKAPIIDMNALARRQSSRPDPQSAVCHFVPEATELPLRH
ncbi:hypothetical protein, partial [Mesorhizobium sp. M8A.F.Ca.ET.213.01.1.1]|uniref:hypothetical protein n=1 Tax=Mesorhizobium sp. M8A.F.Ca.ET.213.01.1.1 TaxID=2563970 RepID=UPI001AED54F3